jgi:hypothetical protein
VKRPAQRISDADWIREYSWRVRKMLTAALRNAPASKRVWYPRPKNAVERSNYVSMRESIDRVVSYVDACEKSGDATAIERMSQYAAIKALWDGWRTRRLDPFWENYHRKTRSRKNQQAGNVRAKQEADEKALKLLDDWIAKNRRVLIGLTARQTLRKYRSTHRLPDRKSRRLTILVNARIKKS